MASMLKAVYLSKMCSLSQVGRKNAKICAVCKTEGPDYQGNDHSNDIT